MNSSSSSGSINQVQQVLYIRSDVFEHAVFPTPAKLTLINLVNLFGSLNQVANIEKKITLQQFKEHTQKHTSNISEREAEIYFLSYKIVTEEDINFVIQAAKSQSNPQLTQQQQAIQPTLYADVRGLAVFFFLQLFSISARNQFSMDFRKNEFNTHFNEGFRGNLSHNFSPLNSPRSKTTRTTPQFSSEQQQAIYYIRYNIKTILKLLSNDINNEDCLLTSQDFNILQLILKPELSSQNKVTFPSSFQASKLALNQAPSLASYSGKFNVVNRVNMNSLSEYISTSISMNENAADVIYIQGLTKSVMCKDEKTCGGQDLRILNCEDSYIYIDAAVLSLSVTNCTNTTIFIAAVNKICTIDKSENLTITVASNFLRIGNTIDSTIYYYGSYYPVLYGDNRSITLAPNNSNFIDLFERMKQAKIPLNYKSSLNFASPIVMNQNQGMSYTVQSIKEFFPANLPPQFKPVHHSQVQTFESILSPQFDKYLQEQKVNNNLEVPPTHIIIPLLAPNDYRDQIIQRFKQYTDYQNLLKSSGLSDSQSRLLQSAIQGYFREWMVQSGQIKPISDLVKMINQD